MHQVSNSNSPCGAFAKQPTDSNGVSPDSLDIAVRHLCPPERVLSSSILQLFVPYTSLIIPNTTKLAGIPLLIHSATHLLGREVPAGKEAFQRHQDASRGARAGKFVSPGEW